jgi:hypothetical protein
MTIQSERPTSFPSSAFASSIDFMRCKSESLIAQLYILAQTQPFPLRLVHCKKYTEAGGRASFLARNVANFGPYIPESQ